MVGDKALARQLSLKGKEESELMKAAHISASQAIYKHRNPVSGKSSPDLKQREPNQINPGTNYTSIGPPR